MKKILACTVALLSACSETTIEIGTYGDYPSVLESNQTLINDAIGKDFETKINVNTWGDHHDIFNDDYQSGKPTNAIYFVDALFTRSAIESDFFEPLNDITSLDQFSSYATEYAQSGGDQLLLPMDKTVAVSYYRRDILDRLEVQPSLPLATWDEFVELGITIKSELGYKLVNNASSIGYIIIENDIPAGESVFFDSNHNPVLTSARFVKALEVVKALFDNDLDLNTGMWNDDWYGSLREGSTAFEINANWLLGHLEGWIAVDSYGQWGVTSLPENNHALMSGTYIGIAKNIEDDVKEKSKEIVKLFLTESFQKNTYQDVKIFPSLSATYNSAELSQANGYLGGDNILSLVAQSSDLVEPHTPTTVDYIAEDAFWEAMMAVKSGTSITDALESANNTVLTNTVYTAWKNKQ